MDKVNRLLNPLTFENLKNSENLVWDGGVRGARFIMRIETPDICENDVLVTYRPRYC